MSKILITGSEGFIGKSIVEYFKDAHTIINYDVQLSVLQDVREKDYTIDFVNSHKPDVIIHLAANPDVNVSFLFPDEDLVLNVMGTINMLEAARINKVSLFIFTSTAQVYGEPLYLEVAETHPLKPKSPYGIGKVAAEMYCQFYFQKYKVPIVIFRLFNIYGPRQSENFVIPNLIKKIKRAHNTVRMIGTKEDSRDFLYIDDLCNAFERAMEVRPCGEIFNIGSGKEMKILDLARLISELLQRNIDFIYENEVNSGKIVRMRANIEKVQKHLGWKPKVSIKEGILKMLEAK